MAELCQERCRNAVHAVYNAGICFVPSPGIPDFSEMTDDHTFLSKLLKSRIFRLHNPPESRTRMESSLPGSPRPPRPISRWMIFLEILRWHLSHRLIVILQRKCTNSSLFLLETPTFQPPSAMRCPESCFFSPSVLQRARLRFVPPLQVVCHTSRKKFWNCIDWWGMRLPEAASDAFTQPAAHTKRSCRLCPYQSAHLKPITCSRFSFPPRQTDNRRTTCTSLTSRIPPMHTHHQVCGRILSLWLNCAERAICTASHGW